MKDRVMVDIETLGLERDSAILSIGAVRFDRTGIADRFHEFIDQRTCHAAGLSVDIETLDWHLSQGTIGAQDLVDGRELDVALEYFVEWYADADEVGPTRRASTVRRWSTRASLWASRCPGTSARSATCGRSRASLSRRILSTAGQNTTRSTTLSTRRDWSLRYWTRCTTKDDGQ